MSVATPPAPMVDPLADLQLPVPFRMQPGLARVDEAAVTLTPLDPASALARERHAHADVPPLAAPGLGNAAVRDTLRAALTCALRHPQARAAELRALAAELNGDLAAASDELASLNTLACRLALCIEDDLALLDGRDARVPWMLVRVPSHWAPEDKLGLRFDAIHAPVADAPVLTRRAAELARLVASEPGWQRQVFTLTADDRHDQHPGRVTRRAWPALAGRALINATWLRLERQQFVPVRDGQGTLTGQALFAIRVSLYPLATVIADPTRARALHDALASMSPAVLAYKGLAPVRDAVLQALTEPTRP